MTTTLDFAVVALPLTLGVFALLFFGRRHIHGQMEQIAEKAEVRAAARFQRAVARNAAIPGVCEAFVPPEGPQIADPERQAA